MDEDARYRSLDVGNVWLDYLVFRTFQNLWNPVVLDFRMSIAHRFKDKHDCTNSSCMKLANVIYRTFHQRMPN